MLAEPAAQSRYCRCSFLAWDSGTARQRQRCVASLGGGGQATAQPCSLSASAMSAAMTPILKEFMNTSSSVVRGACAALREFSSVAAVPLIATTGAALHRLSV